MALVAFDLNGTLLDPAALAAPLGGTEADVALVGRGLDDAIHQGMVATLVGAFDGFAPLLREGIAHELRLEGRDEALADAALERTADMAPSPGALEALGVLADAGHELAVVTNSARATATAALERQGLLDRLAFVLGTDEVGATKPDPRVYAALVARAGRPPEDVWLVAAHWWDVLGATRAGLRTGWVAARERDLLAPLGRPTVEGADLPAVARAIVAAAAAAAA